VARERFLGIMQVQADRMARLIDDLLSLSRIELNAQSAALTSRSISSPSSGQVADGLQTLARIRDVAVVTSAPSGPLLVLGDATS